MNTRDLRCWWCSNALTHGGIATPEGRRWFCCLECKEKYITTLGIACFEPVWAMAKGSTGPTTNFNSNI